LVHVLLLVLQFAVICFFDGAEVEVRAGGSSWRRDLLRKCKDNLWWLRIASLGTLSFHVLPIEDGDDLTQFNAYNCIPMYNLRQLGVSWVFGMLLILTFGVAYPPLSVVIFAELAMLSLLRQLCIYRHLQQLQGRPEQLSHWNKAFKLEMGHLMTILFNPKPAASTLAAVIIAIFIADMLVGSGEHDTLASVYCCVLIGWGILISVLYYHYEEKLRKHELTARLASGLRRFSFDAVELATERVRSFRATSQSSGALDVEVSNPIISTASPPP
jgi:hypothetical protein